MSDPSDAETPPGNCPVPADAEGSESNMDRLAHIVGTEGGSVERSRLFGLATSWYGISPEKAEYALRKGLTERPWMVDDDGVVHIG